MKAKISVSHLVICLVSFSVLLLNSLVGEYSTSLNVYVAVFVFVLSVYLAYKTKKTLHLFIVFLFIAYCNYSILYGRYINPDSSIINNIISGTDIDHLGINVLLLFISILMVFWRTNDSQNSREYRLVSEENRNTVLVWVSFAIIVFIAVVYFRPSAYNQRAGYSPIYEYSILFFIIGFFYSGKTKSFSSRSLFILLLVYVLRDLYGGHRVTSLQLMIVVILVFLVEKITYRHLIVFFFLGIFIMNLAASYRVVFDLSNVSLSFSLGRLSNMYFAFDTAFFAYAASLTFAAVRNMYMFTERIGQFSDFLTSQFVIGTVGESLYTLSRRYYAHSNGGLLPFHFYYYLGWFGVIISSALVGFYYRLIASTRSSSSGLRRVVITYVVATVPRWYLYSPNQLIRGVSLCVALYYSYHLVNILMQNKMRSSEPRELKREA